ncbi:hypothetical protein C2S51_018107 [Perilla frutescens var. frutescens]|nr:hypothetical protein C2S51_018107 [Perilla frutescens var. frutescens]
MKDLEARITELITCLTSIKSEKEKIDQSLRNSVSTERSAEYPQMEKNISDILKKCTELINKYTVIPSSQLSSTTLSSMIKELEKFKSKIIEELKNLKWKRQPRKCFKHAKLSREFGKLSVPQCSDVLLRLKPEYMTQKVIMTVANMEKLDDDGLEEYETYVDSILGCLDEKEIKVVGIYGIQGMGKTTVMKKLYNRLIEIKSLSGGDNGLEFDHVIMIEYTQQETEEKIVENLQNEIMRQLNIDRDAIKSKHMNANTISTFLRHRKYVLLMDNVLDDINLGELGMRDHHDYKNVVIASWKIEVINSMTDHVVEIEKLTKDAAWRLFENVYGKTVPGEGPFRNSVDKIVELCYGIPFMIQNIAILLRRNEENEDFLKHLKRSLQSNVKSIDDLIRLGEIGKAYEMMYGELGPDIKKCLLYGTLFPIESEIYKDYLIECWIAEGFMMENAVPKVKLNRERGQGILNRLTELKLLQWCSDKKYVKVSMYFRRVAIAQAYPNEEIGVTCVSCDDLEPSNETWTKVRRMSLIGCLTDLPKSPKCYNICTLLLQSKQNLERLADLFFDHMEGLQVLDLSNTEIKSLPTSMSKLVNLKSLYLNDCKHLSSLPPAADKLQKLEFIDICRTLIPSLPKEIKCMVDLRCLRVSFPVKRRNHNSKGKEAEDLDTIIPSGIISKLKKLEELSIDTTFKFVEAEGLAEEMASLKYLTTLCFNFPNVSSFDKSVAQRKSRMSQADFRSFKIFIGSNETQHPCATEFSGILPERRLRFSTNEVFSQACKDLLKQATDFEIIGHDGVKTMNQFESHSVKVCVVEGCKSLKSFSEGYVAGKKQESLLQNLEKLYLYDLQLLQYICEGPAPSKVLVNLTVLTLNGCPKLTKIFDPTLARALKSLRDLNVENCFGIVEVIERSVQEGGHVISEIEEVPAEGSSNSEQNLSDMDILISLRSMKLSNLPNLECICQNNSISWKSLASIIINRCGNLQNLSLTCMNAKKLASIQCEKRWWTTLQVPAELKKRLDPFCSFDKESAEPETHPEGESSTSRGLDVNAWASSNSCTDPPEPSNGNVVHGAQSDEETKNPDVYCYDCLTFFLAPVLSFSSMIRFFPNICIQGNKGVAFFMTRMIGDAFEKNLETIWRLLEAGDALRIGDHGMGGAGKTTLAKQINNRLVKQSQGVFWIRVSQDFSIKSLQDQIDHSVGVKDLLDGNDEVDIRAAKLYKALSQKMKNSVLMLIITTRSLEVCHKMGCQARIAVQKLDEDDAWKLFSETLSLGDEIKLSPQVEEIAKSVAKLCGGLPLAIITVAGSMRGEKSIHSWRNTSAELKESVVGEFEAERNWSENSSQEGCWTKERAGEHNLTKGSDYECVKMHDLVRGMALKISEGKYMVRTGDYSLKEIPKEEEWTEDLEKVSLMKNDIGDIPDGTSPNCPKLSTLLLCWNPLQHIPDSFFYKTKGLVFLNLCYTKISMLPNSVSELKSLEALLLEGCEKLEKVPYLGNLKALKELNLDRTAIKELPQGVEELLSLKSLSIDAPQLEMPPEGLLLKLVRLEYVKFPFHVQVPEQGIENFKQVERFWGRVKNKYFGDCDRGLILSECNVKDEQVLGQDIESLTLRQSLKRLTVRKCGGMKRILRSGQALASQISTLEYIKLTDLEDLKRVVVKRTGEIGPSAAPRQAVFSSLMSLYIHKCNKMKKLGLSALGFPNLQSINIVCCEEMEKIFEDEETAASLPKLRVLWLEELPRLKRVCKATIICNSIWTIWIKNCPRLMKKLPLHLDVPPSPPPTFLRICVEREWWESLEWDDPNLPTLLEPFLSLLC